MYLCKTASKNKPTDEGKPKRNVFDELFKSHDITISPTAHTMLGGGAILGTLINAKDRPLLGAIRGMGTGAGAWGGWEGGGALADLLMQANKFDDFEDSSKRLISGGMKLSGSILGSILANRLIKATTE